MNLTPSWELTSLKSSASSSHRLNIPNLVVFSTLNWWKILHKVPPLSPNVEESTLFSEVNLLIRKSAKSKSYTWGKEGWWKGGKRIAVRTSNDDEKGKALRKTGIHPEVMTVNSEARFDINQMSYNPLVLPPIPPPPQMPTVLQPCWLNSSYQSLNKNVSSLPPVEHLWLLLWTMIEMEREKRKCWLPTLF